MPTMPRKTMRDAPALPIEVTVRETSEGSTLDWNIAGIFIPIYYDLVINLLTPLSTPYAAGSEGVKAHIGEVAARCFLYAPVVKLAQGCNAPVDLYVSTIH